MCRQRGPEGTTGRPCEQFGIFGHGHDATEGGVDVSEVVLQGGHLLSILLCGEDLWGKLSQLRRKYEHQVYLAAPRGHRLYVVVFFRGITYLGPRDVDRDFVEGPYDRLRTRRSGEAAVITVILTHVVLRQEAHQREWLHFSSLALGGLEAHPVMRITTNTKLQAGVHFLSVV